MIQATANIGTQWILDLWNGMSGTTRVSWYQKGKNQSGFTGAGE